MRIILKMETTTTSTPTIFFKYRADSEWTEGIFEKKAVWLAAAANLNDPLECRTGLIPEAWKRETIYELEQGQIWGVLAPLPKLLPPETLFSLSPRDTRRWLKRFKSLSHAERVKAIRKLYSDHEIELSRPDKIFEQLTKQLAAVGIFSMSSKAESQLMWSHYAGGHSGLALGFATTDGSRLADPLHLLQVSYRDEKPTFQAGFLNQVEIGYDAQGRQFSRQRFSFEDPVLRAAFSTKPLDWKYEDEWRYIEERGGEFPWPAPLVEVVFGLKMPLDRRKEYMRKARKAAGAEVRFSEIIVTPDASSFKSQPFE